MILLILLSIAILVICHLQIRDEIQKLNKIVENYNYDEVEWNISIRRIYAIILGIFCASLILGIGIYHFIV